MKHVGIDQVYRSEYLYKISDAEEPEYAEYQIEVPEETIERWSYIIKEFKRAQEEIDQYIKEQCKKEV